MAERNSVYIFKGPSLDEFREAITSAVEQLGGKLDWDARPESMSANLLTSHNADVHAAYIHCEGYRVAQTIGRDLAIPWINVRIQEGALWDYSLYLADSHVDNFSTIPEYWDEDAEWIATQRGNPHVLAETWSIDQAAIDRYLQPWGYEEDETMGVFRTTLRGKAYPDDKYEYGDIWQMTDFIRALGAHDPNFDQPHCFPRGLQIKREQQYRNRTKR